MKLREWSRSVWNKLDMVAMILFFVGFGWSFYDRRVERVILAVDLVIWVIKFAQFYRMFSTLGPYLIMIYRMVSTVKNHIPCEKIVESLNGLLNKKHMTDMLKNLVLA